MLHFSRFRSGNKPQFRLLGHWQYQRILSHCKSRMKRLLSLVVAQLALLSIAQAETLPEHFAAQGELRLAHLASAPFPHPQRAEGHKYKDQFFSAAEHYEND